MSFSRYEIFSQFGTLLLLCKGHTIYFGDVSGAVEYFSKLGFTCDQYENPADYFSMCGVHGICFVCSMMCLGDCGCACDACVSLYEV